MPPATHLSLPLSCAILGSSSRHQALYGAHNVTETTWTYSIIC
jgi:hypothetical protein